MRIGGRASKTGRSDVWIVPESQLVQLTVHDWQALRQKKNGLASHYHLSKKKEEKMEHNAHDFCESVTGRQKARCWVVQSYPLQVSGNKHW